MSNDPILDDLFAYIDASPSPFHAVDESASRLSAAGFSEVSEADPWGDDLTGTGYVRRSGALIAWRRSQDLDPPFGLLDTTPH